MQEKFQPKLNFKKLVRNFLILFVGLSVVFLIYRIANKPCCEADEKKETSVSQVIVNNNSDIRTDSVKPLKKVEKSTAKNENKRAVVYYFYTNQRCPSCVLIEQYTREAIEKNFSTPYKGWEVSFTGVNVDDPSNRHFIYDYLLRSKSVVVQKFEDEKAGKWVNLIKIWYLLGNKDSFINYITEETKKFLDNDS